MGASDALFGIKFLSNGVACPTMIVSFSDSAQVLKCSYICGFRLVKPDALLEAFCGICNIKKMDVKKAIVTERQFWNALQKFIPKTIPEEVDYVLSSLFHLCTPSKGGNNKWSALLIELLCTLSIFCNGSKSLKLAFMFSIFTDNEDGILKEEEFIFMMSTILKGTCWLTDWGRSQDPEELSSWALVASEVTLQRMLHPSMDEEDDRKPVPVVISIQSFGGWYNAEGRELISWIELISLIKWENTRKMGSIVWNGEEGGNSPMLRSIRAPEYLNGGDDMDSIFQFPVYSSDGSVSIVFIREDVEFVLDTAKSTGLEVTSPTTLSFLLKSPDSKSNSVSALAFNAAMDQIFKDNGLSGSKQKSYAQALYCLFLVFDSEDKGSVDADDLSVGLSVLCAGNKSTKLAFAFNAMDSDNDGLLDQQGLGRLFCAFFLSLFSFSSGAAHLSTKELGSLAENAALHLSSQVMSDLNTDKITLEDIASWYGHQGARVASILELLHLCKWQIPLKLETGGNNAQARLGTSKSSPGPDLDPLEYIRAETGLEVECESVPVHPNEPPAFKSQSEIVVSELRLCPNFTLRVTHEDVDFIQRVLTCSQLGKLSPKKMKDLMHSVTGISQISENVHSTIYSNFIRSVILPTGVSADDENVVSFALSNIFGALEKMKQVDGGYPKAITPGVPLRDILCGLAILCEENVEAKMLFMFGLYEIGPSTPRADLRVLLRSALRNSLTTIFACLGQTLDFNAKETRNAVINVARIITEQASFEPQHIINLLKAIDATCWVVGTPPSATFKTQNLFVSSSDGDSAGDPKWAPGSSIYSNDDSQQHMQKVIAGGRGGPSVPMMTNGGSPINDKDAQVQPLPNLHFFCEVSCTVPPLLVMVSTKSAKNVLYLASRTGLSELEVSEVYDIFFSASENNLLDKGAFDSCIKHMIPRDKLDKEERHKFSALFSSIYYAFQKEGSSTSGAVELAAGFTIFCKGSKTSKLDYAFKAMDEDNKGGLSKSELAVFIRAFLTTVVVASENNENQALSKEVLRSISEGAIWTSASIFFSCIPEFAVAFQTPYINFNQFAVWYNKKGFEDAPWLEMFNLNKWVPGPPQ